MNSNVVRLTVLELGKMKRKVAVVLPLALIVLFAFWGSGVTAIRYSRAGDGPYDPSVMTINVTVIGSLMLPLLVGSTALILATSDKAAGMLSRLQTLGFRTREIGVAKGFWLGLISFLGVIAVAVATIVTGRGYQVDAPRNAIIVAVFGLLMEAIALVAIFTNLSLRTNRHGLVLALALVGTLVGSAAHMIPRAIALWIPFTLAGGFAVVDITPNGLVDAPLTLSDLFLLLAVVAATIALCSVFFPRRFTDDQ